MDIQELLTKYQDEMEVADRLPEATKPYYKAQYVWNTPITNKQNYINWLHRERPLFMPMPAHVVSFGPACIPDVKARHSIQEVLPQDPDMIVEKDMFGIDWVYSPVVGGSIVRTGDPAVADLAEFEKYITFPDVDSWDWEECAARNEVLKNDEFARKIIFYTGYFERLISWIDFEDAAVALIDDDSKEDVHRALDAIVSTYEKIFPKIKQYFDVDCVFFHDDWGSQQQPFFSLDTAMEMLVPYISRMTKCCHDNGIMYEMHSCGNHGPHLVPAMIAAGVDTWRPQPMNDMDAIFETMGTDMLLHATIDPPREGASDEEIMALIEDFFDRFVRDDHNAMPYFVPPKDLSSKFYPYMYAFSREYFATH